METPNAPNSEGSAAVTDPPADLSQRLSILLAGIARGDQAAFAEFYQLTSRRVFGMARRVLIDPELSEDTTQEVFLQVWQNAAKFDPQAGSPLSWLMTISHRRAVDKVRSSQSSTDREARYGASTQDIALTAVAPPGTEIRRFDDDASGMQALMSGQVDALGCSTTVAAQIEKRAAPNTYEEKFVLKQQVMGVALRPGQTALETAVNGFIDKNKANGELDKLYQKWLGTKLPAMQAS